MLALEEARARILDRLAPTGVETVELGAALGRVLAEPLTARLSNPPADVSAMDGYAVRSADASAGARVRLIGEAPAGHPFAGRLEAGDCVRLFTGSVMPEGSDAVLIQENATRDVDTVVVREAVAPARHVRPHGQDFTRGAVVLAAGRRLGPREIGIAAAANQPWLACHRRPVVALLSTGDEVALPGGEIPPGGIANSNGPMLAALVAAAGGVPQLLKPAPDQAAAIAERVSDLHCDMLVTIGGASVGAYDLVQAGLGELAFAVDFWKIAMRPGKPLMHGRLRGPRGETPVLGLPGNPVSAYVCAILFLLPAIAALSGSATGAGGAAGALAYEQAVLDAPLAANDERADHLRARLVTGDSGELRVAPFRRQDSGMLSLLQQAGALILRPPHAPAAPRGATVPILRLDRLGL